MPDLRPFGGSGLRLGLSRCVCLGCAFVLLSARNEVPVLVQDVHRAAPGLALGAGRKRQVEADP